MKKGITLVAITAVVLIMIILATTVTITGANVLENSKKMKFATELLYMQETIENYKSQNGGTLPIKGTQISAENLPEGQYYEIDMSLLGLIDTSYGRKLKGDEKDIYVLEKNIQEVYYLKGIKIGSAIYYNLTDELKRAINYTNTNIVTKDGINFEISDNGYTNQQITLEVQVPSEYTNIVVKSQNTTISNYLDQGVYRVYTITKASNFDVVVNYTKNSKSLKQVYTVSNFDNTAPTISVKNKSVINDDTSITLNTDDNLSGIKLIQYAKDKVEKKYFVTDKKGIDVSNNNVVVDKYTKYATFYIEDNAGNSNILQVTLDTLVTEKDYVDYGLILHYDGINNTGNGHSNTATTWKDLSGNGNDGILNGFNYTNSSGWSENSIFFDGSNDWVNCGKVNPENITFEVMYSTNTLGINDTQVIAENHESGGFGIEEYKGKAYGIIYINNNYRNVESKIEYPINKIASISLTYDGNTEKIYEYGSFSNYLEISGVIGKPTNNTVFSLGANPSGSTAATNFLNGKIYSVRIYNRALTEDEIKQNYNVDRARFGL